MPRFRGKLFIFIFILLVTVILYSVRHMTRSGSRKLAFRTEQAKDQFRTGPEYKKERTELAKDQFPTKAEYEKERTELAKDQFPTKAEYKKERTELAKDQFPTKAEYKKERTELAKDQFPTKAEYKKERTELAKDQFPTKAEYEKERTELAKEQFPTKAEYKKERTELAKDQFPTKAEYKKERTELAKDQFQTKAEYKKERTELAKDQFPTKAEYKKERTELAKDQFPTKAEYKKERTELAKDQFPTKAEYKKERTELAKDQFPTKAEYKKERTELAKDQFPTKAEYKKERTELAKDQFPTKAEYKKMRQSLPNIKPETSTRHYNEVEVDTKVCPRFGLPRLDGYHDHWQKVSRDPSQFVFSAYVDNTTIRLFGAAYREGRQPEQMFCQIWHKRVDGASISEKSVIQTPAITNATLEIIPEHHQMRYTAVFFKCPFPKDIIPYTVSLVPGNRCQSPINHILIAKPSTKKYKFAVCVKSIHNNFNDVHKLVQFIELGQLLGAEKFTFYDYEIGQSVREVLAMYINQGIAELISWKIPIQWYDIHDFGLLGCLNECLYRIRQTSEYIVFVDLDEFIIPRNPNHITWKDMLEELPHKGAYTFRHTFFPINWPSRSIASNSGDDNDERYQLTTFSKLDRELKIFPNRRRSKLIVRADAVEIVGNHFVWKMHEPWESMTVDPDVALNQHYRYWPEADFNNKTRDLTMLKYRDDLLRRVSKAWERITNEIGLTPDDYNS